MLSINVAVVYGAQLGEIVPFSFDRKGDLTSGLPLFLSFFKSVEHLSVNKSAVKEHS